MKIRKLTFEFPEPLDKTVPYRWQNGKEWVTEELTQEQILREDVIGIRFKVKRELDKVLRSVNLIRWMNKGVFDLIRARVGTLEVTMDNMIYFDKDKDDPKKYLFCYPADTSSLLAIRDIGSKLHLSFLKDKDLIVGQVLREQELITAFKKYAFVDMQIDPESVKITNELVEGVVGDVMKKEEPTPTTPMVSATQEVGVTTPVAQVVVPTSTEPQPPTQENKNDNIEAFVN